MDASGRQVLVNISDARRNFVTGNSSDVPSDQQAPGLWAVAAEGGSYLCRLTWRAPGLWAGFGRPRASAALGPPRWERRQVWDGPRESGRCPWCRRGLRQQAGPRSPRGVRSCLLPPRMVFSRGLLPAPHSPSCFQNAGFANVRPIGDSTRALPHGTKELFPSLHAPPIGRITPSSSMAALGPGRGRALGDPQKPAWVPFSPQVCHLIGLPRAEDLSTRSFVMSSRLWRCQGFGVSAVLGGESLSEALGLRVGVALNRSPTWGCAQDTGQAGVHCMLRRVTLGGEDRKQEDCPEDVGCQLANIWPSALDFWKRGAREKGRDRDCLASGGAI